MARLINDLVALESHTINSLNFFHPDLSNLLAGDLSQTDLFSVINAIYSFRNEYIAHQDRELSDLELAKKALIQWASGLHRIWSCR